MKEEGGMDLRTLENLPTREVKGNLEAMVKGSEETPGLFDRRLQQSERPRSETKMKIKA